MNSLFVLEKRIVVAQNRRLPRRVAFDDRGTGG